jgi:hypothetical protein
MKIKEAAKFATGVVLFTPLFAAEDVLRYFGAKVPQTGIHTNDDGQSILDIWRECAPAAKTSSTATTKTQRQIFEEQYEMVVKATEDKEMGSFHASVDVKKR